MLSMSHPGALTPLMQQYLGIKKDYPDSVVFFRLGDFYEMFFEDAVTAAPLLEVQLTSRDKSSENPIPMCGIPYHAASNYIQKLIQKGLKVAICEQTEVPVLGKAGKTIIKREVARVVTPALVGDPDLVSDTNQNLLLTIHSLTDSEFELAILDLLGGELRLGHVSDLEGLFDWVLRLNPKEFLIHESQRDSEWFSALKTRFAKITTTFRSGIFTSGALAASRAYLRETIKRETPFSFLEPISLEECDRLSLDATALGALEVIHSHSASGESSSLLSVLDCCVTPMGRRNLRDWLSRPLLHISAIVQRHESVEFLVNTPTLFESLKKELTEIRDLERLTSKTVLGLSMPRDLVAIRENLKHLPSIKAALRKSQAPLLREFETQMNSLPELVQLLEESLKDEVPATLRDGNIFKDSYRSEIKELRSLSQNAKSMIAAIETRERESTGISSLKIKFSKVFGYTFEVTASHLKKVPEHFIRKQTIANGERFITEELKKFEEKVMTAEVRLKAIEEELFLELRGKVAEQSSALMKNAKILGALDCLLSFAKVSRERGYQRPTLHTGWDLSIKAGRHPVVETKVERGKFIPNDIVFNEDTCRTLLITGPNMAGKSTIMRQVALISIMAQAGCFVPASRAQLPILDAIFTRVGSSDDLARGQSTFMVEMSEVARILERATSKSLLVVDEIGRGTSTYDGLSLAWALLENIHTHLRAKTLFATHFHELTALEKNHPSLRNANVLVKKLEQEVIFLHQLEFGCCNRSYGIEVARLAGLPAPILERAAELLESLENEKRSVKSFKSIFGKKHISKSPESGSLIES
jgi:DNA mismatch repair protein MutS